MTQIFAGKLTWKVSEKVNFNFNIFGDPSEEDQVGLGGTTLVLENPDPMLGKGKKWWHQFALLGSYSPDDKFLLEWSLARTNRDLDSGPATQRGRDEILYEDNVSGLWSGGTGYYYDIHSFGTTIGFTGTVIAGNHTVKSRYRVQGHWYQSSWYWAFLD